MVMLMILIFILGYAVIALEHPLKIDKAATALTLSVILWIIYIVMAIDYVPIVNAESFARHVSENAILQQSSLWDQALHYVLNVQIIEHVGEISEILIFLIGAMTIVELIDAHGGFAIITDRITTKRKRTLLWLLGFITFFMSAILDNLTTSIVMTMFIRKLVYRKEERWLFAGIIVLAANSGGAWSPIGDVTTIMLWAVGNVSTGPLATNLLLPCLASFIVPLIFVSRSLKGDFEKDDANDYCENNDSFLSMVSHKQRFSILIIGVIGLLMVPIFKSLLHIPPFMGVMLSLGLIWLFTELKYSKINELEANDSVRVSAVIKRIDGSTLLFFLGILLSVAALQSSGILTTLSQYLDKEVHNVYLINTIIGISSSIVDNVPLVAGAIGMYPVIDSATAAASADPAYFANFVQDGIFWHLLTYCAGVGGSILIIGSAAGVIVMGLEKISFGWYLKKISLIALIGYLVGIAVYVLQLSLFQ
ncbi:MAG: sodium:proton antiporter NhaD [Bacteroidales bacterium]